MVTAMIARRRTVLLLWGLVVLALVPGVRGLKTINSPDIFFPRQAVELARYERLQTLFGNDQALRVVVSGEPLWTAPGLAWLGRFEGALAKAPGIDRVTGPATLAPAGEPWPPTDPSAFAGRLLDDPLVAQLGLVAAEGKLATVLVLLDGDTTATLALDVLRAQLAAEPPPTGLDVRAIGLPVLDETLDTSSREIARQFFPILALFAVLLLAFAFRSGRGVVLPLLFVGACQAVLFGAMGFLGVRMNLLMSVLAPLLFVISLATAVHLLIRCRNLRANGLDAHQAVVESYREKGWAVFWTGLTTMAGFASLTVSSIVPVRSLGFWFGVGILLMTGAAFTLYPALLIAWPGRSTERHEQPLEPAIRALGYRWGRWSTRYRRPLLVVLALSFVAAGLGAPRLRVESNALHYLAPDHPLRLAVSDLERSGVGSAAIEMVLHLPDGDGAGFGREEERVRLEALAARMAELPEVTAAVSVSDLIASGLRRMGSGSFVPGAFGPGFAAGASAPGLGGGGEARGLASYLSADGRHTRVTLFTRTTGAEILDPIEAEATAATASLFPEATVELTGQYTLLLGTQKKLLSTLASSFALTALAILLILRFILRGWSLALIAMPTNLWPIAGVLGVMGWAGLPLDIATVMVASMVLGLAVDDTLHTIGHYRHLAPKMSRDEAIARTLECTAPAYLLTGVILSAGFGVCAFSSFAPTARFGALAALGIALAVLADLFLLPAILAVAPATALAKLNLDDSATAGPAPWGHAPAEPKTAGRVPLPEHYQPREPRKRVE